MKLRKTPYIPNAGTLFIIFCGTQFNRIIYIGKVVCNIIRFFDTNILVTKIVIFIFGQCLKWCFDQKHNNQNCELWRKKSQHKSIEGSILQKKCRTGKPQRYIAIKMAWFQPFVASVNIIVTKLCINYSLFIFSLKVYKINVNPFI